MGIVVPEMDNKKVTIITTVVCYFQAYGDNTLPNYHCCNVSKSWQLKHHVILESTASSI